MFRFSFLCATVAGYLLSAILLPLTSYGHGDLQEQIAEVTIQLSKDPKNAILFHKRGELYRANGQFEEALEDYAAAEHLDTNLPVIHLSRGRTLLEAGRCGE